MQSTGSSPAFTTARQPGGWGGMGASANTQLLADRKQQSKYAISHNQLNDTTMSTQIISSKIKWSIKTIIALIYRWQLWSQYEYYQMRCNNSAPSPSTPHIAALHDPRNVKVTAYKAKLKRESGERKRELKWQNRLRSVSNDKLQDYGFTISICNKLKLAHLFPRAAMPASCCGFSWSEAHIRRMLGWFTTIEPRSSRRLLIPS